MRFEELRMDWKAVTAIVVSTLALVHAYRLLSGAPETRPADAALAA